jgi:predicted GIY-YIG superfamily endonuclease
MSELRFVYVLRSVKHPERHYTGVTANPDARLASHNAGHSPHTAKHAPWQLLVVVEFARMNAALEFERFLSSGSGRAFARRHFGST